jgi:F0F1-type ATP synthase delta subunit
MKKYSRKKLARALPQLLARYPQPEVARLIAKELIKTRSVHELPWLMREAAIAFFTKTGELAATVTSARTLSPAARRQIEQLFKKITGADTITWETKVDQELLGGFVAETPTLEIDASLKTRLNSLTPYD